MHGVCKKHNKQHEKYNQRDEAKADRQSKQHKIKKAMSKLQRSEHSAFA